MSTHSHSHHGSSDDARAILLVGTIFSLIGIIGIIVSAPLIASAQHADQARTATGTAMISRVYPSASVKAACELSFTYTVDGQTYYGSSGGAASSTLCGYHSGEEVAVYYNPAQPSDAAIGATRDLDRLGPTILIALAGLFAVIGLSLIVIWVRSVFKERAAAGAEPHLIKRSGRLTDAVEEPHDIDSSAPPAEGWDVYPRVEPQPWLTPPRRIEPHLE